MEHIGFTISNNLVAVLTGIFLFLLYLTLGAERINSKLLCDIFKVSMYLVAAAFGLYYGVMLVYIFTM